MIDASNIPFGIGGWEMFVPYGVVDRKIRRTRYKELRIAELDKQVRNGLSNLALMQDRVETKMAAREVDLQNQMIAMVHAQEANARSIQNAKAIKRLQSAVRKVRAR